MNIIQKIKMMFPLKKMYVPSGWVIAKNNLIDADVNIFDKLINEIICTFVIVGNTIH